MVDTISPVVHGGRTARYWLNLGLHALGAVVSSAAVGYLLGATGAVIGTSWDGLGLLLVVAAGAAYAARDLLNARVPLPDLKRQVPEWWRTFFSAPVTSMLYGLGLGLAFFTSLAYGTFVVVSVAALTSGSPQLGALLCAPFGLGRALVVATTDSDRFEGAGTQTFLGRANGLTSVLLALGALSLLAA